jgi:hypothetical protein
MARHALLTAAIALCAGVFLLVEVKHEESRDTPRR